jgi:ATP-dependent DNA ligase
MASAKPCAAPTSADNVPAANTEVTTAKKTVRRKTGTITLDSSRQRVRQSIDGSAPSAKPTRAVTPLPDFVEPMKAQLVDSVRPGVWLYEIKFDGYRALALRGGREVRNLSRNQKDLGKKFPEVTSSIAALDVQDATIDGEIVALDDRGRSSFQICCKATTRAWCGRQSFSTHSICCG